MDDALTAATEAVRNVRHTGADKHGDDIVAMAVLLAASPHVEAPWRQALQDLHDASEAVARFAPSNTAAEVTVDAMVFIDFMRAVERSRLLLEGPT